MLFDSQMSLGKCGGFGPLPLLVLCLLAPLSQGAQAAPLWARENYNSSAQTHVCGNVKVIPIGWFDGRTIGPPTITSLAELDGLGKYVAPVLYGGLGNQLFQLAALHVYARSVG